MKQLLSFVAALACFVAPVYADYDVSVTGSTSGPVWGSSPYTDDSNVATAAVHRGLISAGQTATIHVTLTGPQASFAGSTANGVTTYSYGYWGGSYTLSLVSPANQAPVGSISGTSALTVGQSGSWTYSATDGNANLKQWRVSLLPAQAQWTSISGGSQTGSFNYSFSSPGTYTWQLQVEDWAGASHTSTWSVTVSSAPSNRAPSSSISGSTTLAVGQSGTWTYSATDPDSNLKQWRVSLLPNTSQWTQISGGSQTTSFSYSFSSAGTYTWQVAVEDLTGATSLSSCSVTVTAAPSNALSYTVSSSYSTHINYPQYAPSYSYLIDGLNTNGYGYASDTGAYNWLKADLGSAKLVQNICVGGGYLPGWGNASDYSSGATLEYSNDNVSWTTAFTFSAGFAASGTVVSPNLVGRYWRIARTTWLATTEFRFEGTAPPVPAITSSPSAAGTVGSGFSYQATATNSPTSYAASGLPAGLSINMATGLISGTPAGAGTANVSLTATNGSGTSPVLTLVVTISASSSSAWGQVSYTTPGTYNWTAPAGVTSVAVVAVGGGGGGGAGYWAGGGGGGGGLGWKNNIAVIPGQSYLVVVGAGGGSFTAAQQASGIAGGASYFINAANVAGLGGGGGSWGVGDANGNFAGGGGGGYVGTGGGVGGTGGMSSGDTAGGGGGAAGYSGSGGSGYTLGSAGTGGGAAAGNNGGNNSSNGAAQSGGGVGLLGQGSNGAAGTGGGGSGGLPGSANGTAGGSSNRGGLYGGGGGGQSNDGRNTPGCYGADGAVRIIWGPNRAFPSTNTADTLLTPVITSALSASGYAGYPFSYQIVASNGPISYIATGLPAGLSLNAATGLISGTPTSSGNFSIGLQATNAGGSDSKTLALAVTTITSPPAVTSVLTASGSSAVAFTYQITATNMPTSFAATGLPDGLWLNPSTGAITGIPAAGTYNVALAATNPVGASQGATLVLNVANVPVGGQVVWGTPTTTNWTVPAGVTSVSVVVVGGGGGGGGGGGALAYRNNIPVTPGSSASITVGGGGWPNDWPGNPGGNGGTSSFTYAGVASVAGGGSGSGPGGVPSGTRDGGGTGGAGAYSGGYSGGGAGGYTGNGGSAEPPSYAGTGGGGGGGVWAYGAGGGVGLTGQGANGSANGGGGSGGNSGAYYTGGPAFGAGGAGWNGNDEEGGTAGADGAVRIIWGANRSFPATNTGNLPNPPIVTSASTATVTVGSPFTYQITANGSPASYGAASLPAGLSVNATTGLISGTPTVTGVYDTAISATNSIGTYYKRLTLTVASTPTITTQPASQTSAVGSNATFTVVAAGIPNPTYVWRRNGVLLPNGGNVTGATSASLSLIGVQASDAATYSVTVTNSAGSATSTGATLTTVIPPAAPVAHAPTSITSSGLTTNWTVVSGASRYRLDVSTNRNFTTFVSGYQNRDVGLTLSAAVPGLAVDTTYYYRVRAEAGGFAGPSSNIVSTTIPRSAGVASWQDVDGDGLMDEVSPNGVNTYAYAIDDIWLEAIETDQYVINFNAWFDFYWPDGFYLPDFGFTWSVVPSVGGYETRLTHFHSFTAEPGYRYEIWGSRNGGGMWVKEWGPVTLTINDNLEVGRYSGWFHPDDYLSSLFYLVRFGKPIGNVSIGGSTIPSLGTSRGLGGVINAILPTTGGITISIKDAIGQVLKAGPNIGWQVWDGINQIRVGNTTLGGLIDLGITSTGQFQVGLKLDDANTVWFNVNATPPPVPQLAVDANRDGTIEFGPNDITSSIAPYRFWLNDDIDRGHTVDGSDYEQDDIGPVEAAARSWIEDWKYNTVQSKRDLEDFSRIVISAAGLGSDVYLGLKWAATVGAPSIKLFKQYDTGTSYLTNDLQASLQLPEKAVLNQRYPNDDMNSMVAHTVVAPGEVFVLPDGLIDSFGQGSLIFEACTAGTGQLKLVVLRREGSSYSEIGDGGAVWLDLRNIKGMYEHWTVGQGPVPYGGGAPGALAQASSFTYTAQSTEDSKYIIYVHGWNLEQWEKERYAETAYKRLYWQGYKGRFGLFSWPTTNAFDGWVSAIRDGTNYDRGEFSAWRSAGLLEQKLAQLNGQYPGQVYLLAHSMGNVVAGEALRRAAQDGLGVIVRAYVASQSALPVQCYNGSLPDNLSADVPLGGLPRIFDGGWPQTANAYKSWLTGNSAAVAKRVNFFNVNDYALWRDTWQLNEWLKPDQPDLRQDPPDPKRVYRYLDDFNLLPTQDGFGWQRPNGQVDPSDRLYLNNTWFAVLHLGNVADVRDRYEIMSMASESRSTALGATALNEGLDASLALNSIWPPDPSGDARPYSRHKWHSAQFRSSNMLQRGYWQTLLGPQGFSVMTAP